MLILNPSGVTRQTISDFLKWGVNLHLATSSGGNFKFFKKMV